MTTRRLAIRRERVRDWPALAGYEIPSDLGVLSLELQRTPHEKLPEAVAEASGALRSGLDPVLGPGPYQLWLLCLGKPHRSSSRVGAYHAERDKLWAAMEKTKTGLPQGRRIEARVQYGVDFGFAGSIEFELGDLPVALEVTRVENAVCVATDPLVADPLTRWITPLLGSVNTEPPTLLTLMLEVFPNLTLVARGFGQFDDAVVGAEVFGPDSFLDALERSLGGA